MVRLKTIFIFLFILVFSTINYGQNFKAQVVGGLNVAQVDGDSYGGYNQPGIITGMSVYREANDKYNYGLELLLSQKGSHKKTSEFDNTIFKLRYNYICIPLYVDFKSLGPHLKKLNLRLAISNNIAISSKVSYGYGWSDAGISPYELSAYLGVNYKITDKLGLMIRTENSILSIGTPKNSSFYNVSRRGLYNRLISFMVSWDL